MMSVLRSASQKNVQSSRFPSVGRTDGDGVELPGEGAYGVRNDSTSALTGRATGAPFLTARFVSATYAANHGSRAAGPVGFRTSRWRFEPGSPGA
jgi:hypothetical protein